MTKDRTTLTVATIKTNVYKHNTRFWNKVHHIGPMPKDWTDKSIKPYWKQAININGKIGG